MKTLDHLIKLASSFFLNLINFFLTIYALKGFFDIFFNNFK